ncbi:hypothetical protein B5F07_18390 [Lachnoclostridium sp. An169]|uniref:hypothetical protein n=1 Tax=Lachnoclostridium sp. An169 TaxID=1965569 RepID=UPI000B38293B|nr:hypothetical protein [Lachnoclostridium sp. An169]OUP81208.1 hypothetical protein B5F07_18390 [Lachnoclostridium sp. An169]HJA66984.1 hypothetical protein [Candidatus Mediterraneibacter cottocaccae]
MEIKHIREKEAREMYSDYYLTAGADKFYIRETLALNLYNSYTMGFTEIAKIICKRELVKLLGICAAWYKGKINNDTYVNELIRFKVKKRKFKNAKTN